MKIITLKYDLDLLKSFKNRQIVVYVDTLDSLEHKYAEAKRNNSVVAFVVSLPYTSVSQLEFREEWAEIPIAINAYNIGNYEQFFIKVNAIRHLNMRIYLSSSSSTVFTDLKIMASMGVDCGILLEEGVKIDDEKLLDLASYYYMSPVPHATMEPFEFILRHLRDESNVSFESVYFKNPLLFTDAESALNEIEFADDYELKLQHYYNHFMTLDDCSKCPAFKICNRKVSAVLSSCSQTMNEIYEYAEMRRNLNDNQQSPKSICQL
jgi:hypothetical protein